MIYTYDDLIAFVESNDLQNKSFTKVIELYNEHIQEQTEEFEVHIEWFG